MNPTILIVDDNQTVRTQVRELLAAIRPDWEIVGEAGNWQNAVEALNSMRPDVVVLDWSMPDMNGFEATQRIRQLNSDLRITRVCQLLYKSLERKIGQVFYSDQFDFHKR